VYGIPRIERSKPPVLDMNNTFQNAQKLGQAISYVIRNE